MIAQSTVVFSTFAHLLLHNRRQCLTFLMVTGEIYPIHSTKWCLNNRFEVLSTCATLTQDTGVSINWYKQEIN